MSCCDRCVFSSNFRDMGASSPTCALFRDLGASIRIRASYEGKDSCPYSIYFCDLVDAIDRSIGVPDRDIFSSYGYAWSKESKNISFNSDLVVRLEKY